MTADKIRTALQSEAVAARSVLMAIAAEIEGDEVAAADAISGETGLNEAMAAAAKRIAELGMMSEGLKKLETLHALRRARFDKQASTIRTAMADALSLVGQKKMELPTATVYISAGRPSAQILNEEKLPPEYFDPQKPKLNLARVSEALKSGTDVPGATLSNPRPILNIRST